MGSITSFSNLFDQQGQMAISEENRLVGQHFFLAYINNKNVHPQLCRKLIILDGHS